MIGNSCRPQIETAGHPTLDDLPESINERLAVGRSVDDGGVETLTKGRDRPGVGPR